MIKNLKKLSVVLTLSLLALPLTIQAKTLTCPFRDHFTIKAPASAKLLSAVAQNNIAIIQDTMNSFSLSCADNSVRDSGLAVVEIGSDSSNRCKITIQDGPFDRNPTILNSTCNGPLLYTGMDHRFGSYEYELKFR
jgi:hypothetical protein